MRSCRTAKKGATELTFFFSIIAFAVIILIFFALFKISIGESEFRVRSESKSLEGQLSLLSILRTPIEVDGTTINIAELIAQSRVSDEKEGLMEEKITDFMDEVYGKSGCHMMCVDFNKIKGGGCTRDEHRCPVDYVKFPDYEGNEITVSFQPEAEPLTRISTR